MKEYHPIRLAGPWTLGYALDSYSGSSNLQGVGQNGFNEYETEYSSIGEKLHYLKYRRENDQASIDYLATQATLFLKSYGLRFDVIIPVPCTKPKYYPPVMRIAREIGLMMNKPISSCVEITNNLTQAKAKGTKQERLTLRKAQFSFNSRENFRGTRMLLIDDLYDTGATLEVMANLLTAEAFPTEIRVIVLAKTRR